MLSWDKLSVLSVEDREEWRYRFADREPPRVVPVYLYFVVVAVWASAMMLACGTLLLIDKIPVSQVSDSLISILSAIYISTFLALAHAIVSLVAYVIHVCKEKKWYEEKLYTRKR